MTEANHLSASRLTVTRLSTPEVAEQLGLDAAHFGDYAERDQTRREHVLEIETALRLRPICGPEHCEGLPATYLTRLDGIYKYTYTGIVDSKQPKPVRWIGSARKDVRSFPQRIRRDIGKALYAAQDGETDPAAKPLKGFGGTSVMEIVASHSGNTWRAVYTARFHDAVYVLHAFQKKSKTGIATPKKEIDLIRQRLADAEHDYRQRQN